MELGKQVRVLDSPAAMFHLQDRSAAIWQTSGVVEDFVVLVWELPGVVLSFDPDLGRLYGMAQTAWQLMLKDALVASFPNDVTAAALREDGLWVKAGGQLWHW